MAYRVSLAAPAEADLYAAFERIRAAAPSHAERWLTRLFEAIFSLDKLPTRCPVIPEARCPRFAPRFWALTWVPVTNYSCAVPATSVLLSSSSIIHSLPLFTTTVRKFIVPKAEMIWAVPWQLFCSV